jgi:hypothetical protein
VIEAPAQTQAAGRVVRTAKRQYRGDDQEQGRPRIGETGDEKRHQKAA